MLDYYQTLFDELDLKSTFDVYDSDEISDDERLDFIRFNERRLEGNYDRYDYIGHIPNGKFVN